jgi:peptidoglycan/LPS O-acetylase OafA/YrhL
MSVLLVPHDGGRLIGIMWSLEYEMMFYLAFAAFFISARFGLVFFAAWFAAIASVGVWGTGNAEQYRRAADRATHPRLRAQPARG